MLSRPILQLKSSPETRSHRSNCCLSSADTTRLGLDEFRNLGGVFASLCPGFGINPQMPSSNALTKQLLESNSLSMTLIEFDTELQDKPLLRLALAERPD